MEAVGSVVASYFGEKSLQNRIDSQINPFEEPLQLAVTAQRLIGEPIGGANSFDQIPVSFVVFTNEPLYIGEEKFRVMRISASFGHGVVGNQGIATDTVLLLRSESQPDELYVLYDNQKNNPLSPATKRWENFS
jgi:Pyruvate phosphate dikinase, PEP/pyruvate binding domain.